MAAPKATRLAVPLLILMLVVAMAPPGMAQTSRAQVDAACEDSREQLAQFRAARTRFENAAIAYDRVLVKIDGLERQQARVQGSVDHNAEQYASIQAQIEEVAVELYMQGAVSNPGIILSASSVDELITTTEFLSSAALGGQRSLDDLFAARGEMGRFQDELDQIHVDLIASSEEANQLMLELESAMNDEQAAHARLSKRCQELNAKYEAEQAALRAAEAARKAREAQRRLAAQQSNAQAAKVRAEGSTQVGSFICPFTPGKTHFINSWGHPRSGGRSHKGTDMHAAWNQPMFAVQSGTVYLTNSSLGGRSIWLASDTGAAFYYAHLSGFAVGSGERVSQGQVIGYNGNSGNAQGGAPHLHFQIHPGGMGSPAMNPYPQLAAVCG